MQPSLSVPVGRPRSDEQQQRAEHEWRDGEQVGLDHRVLEPTDDLGHKVTGDGSGGSVAQGDGGEDVKLPVPERGKERLEGELCAGRSRPIREETEPCDLLLPLVEKSRVGRRPREAEVHEDGESHSQGSLLVSDIHRFSSVTSPRG